MTTECSLEEILGSRLILSKIVSYVINNELRAISTETVHQCYYFYRPSEEATSLYSNRLAYCDIILRKFNTV